jgi:hypothetical protein
MTKHTPGPWRVSSDEDGVSIRMGSTLRDLSYYDNADLWTCESDEEDEAAMANAHLMAAAPDMLEALENLENDDGTTMPPSAWELVQTAIAKAKGEA